MLSGIRSSSDDRSLPEHWRINFTAIKEEEFVMTLLESVTQVGDPLFYF